MFDQLVDEKGNLLFSKTDGKGYVSQITANNTPITAENYTITSPWKPARMANRS